MKIEKYNDKIKVTVCKNFRIFENSKQGFNDACNWALAKHTLTDPWHWKPGKNVMKLCDFVMCDLEPAQLDDMLNFCVRSVDRFLFSLTKI